MSHDTPGDNEDETREESHEVPAPRSLDDEQRLHPAAGHHPPAGEKIDEHGMSDSGGEGATVPGYEDEWGPQWAARPLQPTAGARQPIESTTRQGDESGSRPVALRTLAIALAAALIGGAAGAGVVLLVDDDPTAEISVERVETPVASPQDNIPIAGAAEVAELVLPSIVTVEVDIEEETFSASASGSGVVLSEDGFIATNHHVVADATDLRVVFPEGLVYEAELVGSDSLTDLAVLRIEAEGLAPIQIGSSEAMSIGDVTIAVGSPLGLAGGPSVTVGVLSAFERRVATSTTELFGMLQTDAPITRGSSGGALVDAEGRLIGITTAIGISDVGAEGLGFAIPVEMAQRVIADLIETGSVSHAFLGITGATFFEDRSDGASAPAGVTIESIVPATAAEAAGLAEGDVITTFDGDPVTTMDRLVVRLRFYRVGDEVELGIIRDDEPLTFELNLLERPEGV